MEFPWPTTIAPGGPSTWSGLDKVRRGILLVGRSGVGFSLLEQRVFCGDDFGEHWLFCFVSNPTLWTPQSHIPHINCPACSANRSKES